MKKFLIGLFVLGLAVVLLVPLIKAQAALGARVTILGNVKIGQNSPLTIRVKNLSTHKEKIKSVTVWVPSGYTIAYPAHNISIRGRSYGPWSTVIRWSGASGRRGYTAISYKITNGGKYLPAGKIDTLPITLKTPTNQKMYPQTVTVY